MAFNFNEIQSVVFGVCLETKDGDSYYIVPCDKGVQDALKEMLAETKSSLDQGNNAIQLFSPAEKYGSTERLRIPLTSDLVKKHAAVYAAENLATDTNGLDNPTDLISYFAIFRDRANRKLMAFRRAGQFKGVVRKHLVAFMNDALCIVPDKLFKLDTDFDFLIFDGQIFIWRPSGFVFTADMDERIAACAMANVDQIAQDVTCVDFTGLRNFVAKHKLAMRLVAAIKTRNDLASITRARLQSECKASGLEVTHRNGKVMPAAGSEMGFLMLLDRRRYTVMLIPRQPETYEAQSRHLATRANQE